MSELYDEDVIAGLSRQIHEARSLPTYITVALLRADAGKQEGPVSPTPQAPPTSQRRQHLELLSPLEAEAAG